MHDNGLNSSSDVIEIPVTVSNQETMSHEVGNDDQVSDSNTSKEVGNTEEKTVNNSGDSSGTSTEEISAGYCSASSGESPISEMQSPSAQDSDKEQKDTDNFKDPELSKQASNISEEDFPALTSFAPEKQNVSNGFSYALALRKNTQLAYEVSVTEEVGKMRMRTTHVKTAKVEANEHGTEMVIVKPDDIAEDSNTKEKEHENELAGLNGTKDKVNEEVSSPSEELNEEEVVAVKPIPTIEDLCEGQVVDAEMSLELALPVDAIEKESFKVKTTVCAECHLEELGNLDDISSTDGNCGCVKQESSHVGDDEQKENEPQQTQAAVTSPSLGLPDRAEESRGIQTCKCNLRKDNRRGLDESTIERWVQLTNDGQPVGPEVELSLDFSTPPPSIGKSDGEQSPEASPRIKPASDPGTIAISPQLNMNDAQATEHSTNPPPSSYQAEQLEAKAPEPTMTQDMDPNGMMSSSQSSMDEVHLPQPLAAPTIDVPTSPGGSSQRNKSVDTHSKKQQPTNATIENQDVDLTALVSSSQATVNEVQTAEVQANQAIDAQPLAVPPANHQSRRKSRTNAHTTQSRQQSIGRAQQAERERLRRSEGRFYPRGYFSPPRRGHRQVTTRQTPPEQPDTTPESQVDGNATNQGSAPTLFTAVPQQPVHTVQSPGPEFPNISPPVSQPSLLGLQAPPEPNNAPVHIVHFLVNGAQVPAFYHQLEPGAQVFAIPLQALEPRVNPPLLPLPTPQLVPGFHGLPHPPLPHHPHVEINLHIHGIPNVGRDRPLLDRPRQYRYPSWLW